MFTGIVESVGTVKNVAARDNYLVLTVSHNLNVKDLKAGDSVACDGACLTITSLADSEFTCEVSQETIARTIIGNYRTGSPINLECAVRVGDRLGGHFVTGHIDTISTITEKRAIGESIILEIQFDEKFDNLVVCKGSIAINGVSLTVNGTSNSHCDVNLIPYTLQHTNLQQLKINDKVNIEFDLIGKYALKAVADNPGSILTFDKLTESGW
jgi:riboflavin synthase